jgi:hypothetical protein
MEGNQMKMREALDAAFRFIGNLEIEPYSPLDEAASELRQRIMDALSAPPRKCDVGTAEEIDARWNAYCEKRIKSENCMSDKNCKGCAWRWAQTPYEEGGAK